MTNTTLESTDRAPNDSNPFKQTAAIIKPQTKFLLDDGEKCSKNYKYDGSTGNLSYHLVKHGIIPPLESGIISPMHTQSASNKNGQKEKELSTLRWILLTTQPLSTITQKAYIEHMYIIDPQFTVPGEKKLRMMIARSYGYNKEKLKLLLKTAQSISLTTDLWSSRSKHGYLGLTATWINKNFEIMDVLLEISYFPTPHTAKAITEGIKNAMQKWEIENLVVSITTDNGANVVAAIRDLTPIKRLSCAAHTLQLAISKGLKVVENLVSRTKQLINFFSTQKQIERLIKVQKEIGYEEPLHLIQDISTRWNSSYLAWDRLIFLQYAVLQLSVNLSCSLISEEKTDGIRLKKIMIKDNEWELLDELCNILAPFEKATRDFSGNTYVTLSQMFPIITDLTNSLKPSDNSYEVLEDSDDNTINSDIVEEESSQIEVDYTDEITTYFLLPVARENKNPLDWWKSKQEIFPVLSIIARKYLGIPATSVASERLFSDAGNHITAKRSLLDPALLGKMVFLKRNMKTMDHINIFPPDLDVENNDYVEDEHELEELLDE
ncbi:zinc finger BED domain-containing protein 1-like [Rhizophagus irregularis DAOM 181602=DAOM 197198]|nr:zinc finger BED domain-containing protein 1-like [Rhizophagus irregularis DAOM 181602=DAOM 197198]GBC35689.2 zinc finger BED domain-containing protein 1-like [Rhizophagus irregularis DAOM 181602=DAOM 197198]GBC40460.2 zinc finger BED domain-containing protein 1-like [Rhizophagus irregularis DAOM 181602=DAOM 197198]